MSPAGAATLAAFAVVAGCVRDAPPAPCPELPACPEPAPCTCPEPACPEPTPRACPEPSAGAATPSPPEPASEEARIALAVSEDLFAGRYEAVRARFVPRLRAELSAARLEEIVTGVVAAHGPPVATLDAWFTTVDGGDRRLPAGSVLLRMARRGVRFRLLVVFDRGGVDGLWLRPI